MAVISASRSATGPAMVFSCGRITPSSGSRSSTAPSRPRVLAPWAVAHLVDVERRRRVEGEQGAVDRGAHWRGVGRGAVGSGRRSVRGRITVTALSASRGRAGRRARRRRSRRRADTAVGRGGRVGVGRSARNGASERPVSRVRSWLGRSRRGDRIGVARASAVGPVATCGELGRARLRGSDAPLPAATTSPCSTSTVSSTSATAPVPGRPRRWRRARSRDAAGVRHQQRRTDRRRRWPDD